MRNDLTDAEKEAGGDVAIPRVVQYDISMVTRAARVKGWELLRTRWVEGDGVQAPGWVTLCKNRPEPQPEYVVHFFNAQDGGFHEGKYHEQFLDVLLAYDTRCERYTRHMRST
jgi:hypothetical protein